MLSLLVCAMNFRLISASLLALVILGCDAGSTRNSTYEEVPAEEAGTGRTSTVTVNSGGDAVVNDVIVTGNGIYIYNTGNGDITYVGGDFYNYIDETDNSTGGGAEVTGMSEKTCKENGFFWCTVSNTCIDNGGSGGTGSCSKSGS